MKLLKEFESYLKSQGIDVSKKPECTFVSYSLKYPSFLC